MLVVCSRIYVEITVDFGTEAVLGKHPSHSLPDNGFRFAYEEFLGSGETLASRIAGMAYIHLVRKLLSGETDFFCIDNNDIISTVHVRSERSLVLAAQHHCYSGSQTTDNLIGRINHYPLFLNHTRGSRHCFVALCVHCVDF